MNPLTDITNPMSLYNDDTETKAEVKHEAVNSDKITLGPTESIMLLVAIAVSCVVLFFALGWLVDRTNQ